MGRKVKPTVLKILAGNPGKRPLNKNEPVAVGDLTDPPDHLSDTQKQIWRDAIAAAPRGLLKTIDGPLLEIWCVSYDLHKSASVEMQKTQGLTQRGSRRTVVASALEGIMNRQAAKMLKAASELGFSPAARPRIRVDAAPDKPNPFLVHSRDA